MFDEEETTVKIPMQTMRELVFGSPEGHTPAGPHRATRELKPTRAALEALPDEEITEVDGIPVAVDPREDTTEALLLDRPRAAS